MFWKPVNARVCGYVEDSLAVTVAVADLRQVTLGISVQYGYPLAMIERNYGVPFGRLRCDSLAMISGPDELHACK